MFVFMCASAFVCVSVRMRSLRNAEYFGPSQCCGQRAICGESGRSPSLHYDAAADARTFPGRRLPACLLACCLMSMSVCVCACLCVSVRMRSLRNAGHFGQSVEKVVAPRTLLLGPSLDAA